MNDRNPVGSGHLGERIADRRHQSPLGPLGGAVEGASHEMGEHLGIGLRVKLMSFLLQLGSK